jgi:VWFA-related protein
MARSLPFLAVVVVLSAAVCAAQSTQPSPSPAPSPPAPVGDSQEKVKVFTEEVVISVTAYSNSGHLDPVLEPKDVLVFEDDVRQTVRSVRRVPANVLLALDTGGDLNPAMRASITRDIATRLISKLQSGDRIAALQFGNNLELFQTWTTNKDDVFRALNTKLISGKRPQLAKALTAAALQLSEVPAGTRHLVLITDGVDLSHDSDALTQAIKQLLERDITVHVIGYGSLGRKSIYKQNPLLKITSKKRKSAQDLAQEIMDPTAIPEYQKRNKIYLVIDTDFSRRKTLEAYKEATKLSEVWLTSLAEQTGGLVFMPRSVEEMIPPAEQIAREIDSQYVVTYSPKRPLANATAGEYRRLFVASGVGGMNMRARPGYVVTGP